MRVVVSAMCLLLATTAGCATEKPGSGPSVVHSETATREPSASTASEIVGEWERVTTCQQRVEALEHAGLGQFAPEHAAGEGWLPGVTSPDQIQDPKHPCKDAVRLKHGHFFTSDGVFGSRDAEGNEVDDGSYRSLDQNTIVIEKEFGNVTFDYKVHQNESLFLTPVMPKCAPSGCFAAQWAVAVAYPGLPWRRAEE
jgi:hypothetical protein